MVRLRYLLYLMLWHWIFAAPQINLYYTNWEEESEDDDHPLEHNCLRVIERNKADETLGVSSFCLSELPTNFTNTSTTLFPKSTFPELAKQNITSEQLYRWSAPIDVIERYQYYLDYLSPPSNNHTTEDDLFYNCTLPRFGPRCQYELEFYDSAHSSLYDLIHALDQAYPYQPSILTCYMHLQCNRGPWPLCLDWTDICNGQVDCLDGNFDEEHCWQLEMNECNENEHRCGNGQCIPKAFVGDHLGSYYDCIDGSDELILDMGWDSCEYITVPYRCEDMLCDKGAVLTSSCDQNRKYLLQQAMFANKDESISDLCWSAFKCGMNIYQDTNSTCRHLCIDQKCIEIIQRECLHTMFVPSVPVLFNHVFFVYYKNTSQSFNQGQLQDFYICYNSSYYDINIYWNRRNVTIINQMKCYRQDGIFMFSRPVHLSQGLFLPDLHKELWKHNQVFDYTPSLCNRTNMYQCLGSNKCISIHRRNDLKQDCPGADDEMKTIVDDLISIDEIPVLTISEKKRAKEMVQYLRLNISFPAICNGYVELLPIPIAGQNHTDETECEVWECNNIYTRCNNFWNCPDGADELNCELPFILNCPANEHKCVSPKSNALICLPIARANDGHVDCLGGTDEPALCRKSYKIEYPDNFYCMNSSAETCVDAMVLCDGNNDCKLGDDEQFCDEDWERPDYTDFCYDEMNVPSSSRPDSAKFLCRTLKGRATFPFVYFSLTPPRKFFIDHIKSVETKALVTSSLKARSNQYHSRCHRGLDVRVRLNDQKESTTRTCFCPPNFYGNTCQYQNQRVSLGLKLQAFPDSRQTPFAVVISLIDDSMDRIMHSSEQFTYLASQDCSKRFNVHLSYAIRPKNQTINYTIHIDIYEKISLIYRGSLLFPIPFSFLPVHRLALIANIPRRIQRVHNCFDLSCVHGKCLKYSNNQEVAGFCQCDEGWSGKYCSIRHNCTCSPGSICLGISAHNRRPICICRPDRFGPRCLMKTACQNNDKSPCKDRDQCIPADEYAHVRTPYTCKPSKDVLDKPCEKNCRKIILTFGKDIVVSQSVFFHFIDVQQEDYPWRNTTFLTNLIEPESIIAYWSERFHIAFIEFPTNRYYFILMQTVIDKTSPYRKKIESFDRCPHIREIFNATLVQWHPLRQIKHYHSACQMHSFNLSCFYDDLRFCLCYKHEGKRLANCLDFQHNMTFDCFGQSACQNGAQCFQDKFDCPTKSICICPPCYYGRLCQLSTRVFGLSLDAILGYTILPDASLTHQKPIVKISMALTIIFMVTGLINSVLSLMTFKSKVILEVGCGLYLLASSITTFFTMILFGLKFWFLILTQTGVILNQPFLQIQCRSVEFLLRLGLNTDQWLSACVAIERAVMTIQGTSFNKRESRRVAKVAITIVLMINILSTIYDPIHRRLIEERDAEDDDDDDSRRRIWCIVTYSKNLQVFNSATYLFHFFGPFLINLISATILVTKKSYQQSNLRTKGRFRELFRKQFREHKHLFTGPILLVVLAIPRLIIFFVSRCMESTSDAWLYLLGYFISFIPPMTTFIIFVLPSTVYKTEFHKVIAKYRIRSRPVPADIGKTSSSQSTASCSHIRRRKLMWTILSSIALVLIIISIIIPTVIVKLNEANKTTTTEPKDTSVNITVDSQWMQDGITIVGVDEEGKPLPDANSPHGIYMDHASQSFYIAETEHDRVTKWNYNSLESQTVAGGNGRGNRTNQLRGPTDVVIDKNNDSMIICDQLNYRLVRWPLRNGESGQILTRGSRCHGLAIDDTGDLYVTNLRDNAVVRWKPGITNRTVVAGGNGRGNALNQLNGPMFIFVDQNHSIYVSEENNHRVTKWMQGAEEGIIVAGGQEEGNNLTQLDSPHGVFVDHLGSVYIADYYNYRIMRWLRGSVEGSVVVGDNETEFQSNRINSPDDISFDRENNLYVTDTSNGWVQKFKIVPN